MVTAGGDGGRDAARGVPADDLARGDRALLQVRLGDIAAHVHDLLDVVADPRPPSDDEVECERQALERSFAHARSGAPGRLRAVPGRATARVLPAGDLVMMRRQLRTLAGLAESTAADRPRSGQPVVVTTGRTSAPVRWPNSSEFGSLLPGLGSRPLTGVAPPVRS